MLVDLSLASRLLRKVTTTNQSQSILRGSAALLQTFSKFNREKAAIRAAISAVITLSTINITIIHYMFYRDRDIPLNL